MNNEGVPREDGSTGSELRRTDKSVALRGAAVSGDEAVSPCDGRRGSDGEMTTGEFSAASRTGSKAGMMAGRHGQRKGGGAVRGSAASAPTR